MFELVTEENLEAAAQVHAQSWRESHRGFCSEEFIAAHTAERQMAYIRGEMSRGRVFYQLDDGGPKGIVSVCGSLIENLYVLPREQRKGYGTMLLRFAESLCGGTSALWILSNNTAARSLYQKCGYTFTGRRKELKGSLAELEMERSGTP